MLFFFQAEDGIRDGHVTGVQTCALPISRWARLRSQTGIQSPTEYLKTRYNLPTQQLMAWSGVLLKLFDVGAKWAAIAQIGRATCRERVENAGVSGAVVKKRNHEHAITRV